MDAAHAVTFGEGFPLTRIGESLLAVEVVGSLLEAVAASFEGAVGFYGNATQGVHSLDKGVEVGADEIGDVYLVKIFEGLERHVYAIGAGVGELVFGADAVEGDVEVARGGDGDDFVALGVDGHDDIDVTAGGEGEGVLSGVDAADVDGEGLGGVGDNFGGIGLRDGYLDAVDNDDPVVEFLVIIVIHVEVVVADESEAELGGAHGAREGGEVGGGERCTGDVFFDGGL